MTAVIKVSRDEVARLRSVLGGQASVKTVPVTSPYEVFRVRCENGLIIGYMTGKVVATSEAARRAVVEALTLLEGGDGGLGVVIGSDEAGKGELLGPLTVAAVALTPEEALILRGQGVMDSKELSTGRVVELAAVILGNCLGQYVVVVTPKRFNRLFSEMKGEGKTLNDLLAWGHAKAISRVYRDVVAKAKPPALKVMIDEFDRLKTEKRLQRVLNLGEVTLEQRPEAEENVAVASAGILARASYEAWMDEASARLGLDLRRVSQSQVMDLREVSLVAKVSYLRRREA